MRGRRWLGLVVGVGALAGCTTPEIDDPAAFCQGLTSGATQQAVTLPSGSGFIVSQSAYREIPGSATVVDPLRNVHVALQEKGGVPYDPDHDLRVCAGDCVEGGDSFFKPRDPNATTDHNGILIFTVLVGPQTHGFILEDFGDLTCVQAVNGK
jgi:hypothetical protein